MMNCQQATRLMSDAQERPLSFKERAALKMHVAMCSGCSNFLQQMGTLRDIARIYAKGSEDPDDCATPGPQDEKPSS